MILFKILKLLGVDVMGHCSEVPLSNIELIREKIAGISYVRKDQLAQCVNEYDNIIVIILTAEKTRIAELEKNAIVICSPTKTGDFSINYTFNAINQLFSSNIDFVKIHYINLWHAPTLINRAICEKN